MRFYWLKILVVISGLTVISWLSAKSYFLTKKAFSKLSSLQKNLPTINQPRPLASVLFVGDIMVDRGVEYQIKKHQDWFYPFAKLKDFFKKREMIIGNLEGPIVTNPPHFPEHSLRFVFDPKTAKSLALANFKVLSLANNHTDNMGEEGWQETLEYLQKEGIEAVGHPVDCHKKLSLVKSRFVFLAFNKTFHHNCSDEEISQLVKETRQKYPTKFLVVIFHWGQEYSLKSSISQQKLAHQVIKSGADLIIGAHPHVVQEIEEYQNRLIFYSLGNFIFDQYFSERTQEGLMVGLKLFPDKVIYQLFPVKSKLSQPSLMIDKEKERFLENLAQRSSQNLSKAIKNGIIELSLPPPSPPQKEEKTKKENKQSFTYTIEKGPFSKIPGQLVSHLYNIRGVPNVKALAVSPDGKELWATLLLNKARGVAVFSVQERKNIANLNLKDGGGVEMVFTKDGKKVYVSQMETGKIFEIDTNSKKILRSFSSKSTWTKVLFLSRDEKTLFASNWVGNNISQINLETGKVERLIPTVKTPRGIYVTPDNRYLYVAGFSDGEIEKIDLLTNERKIILKTGGAMRHIVADERRNILFFSDMAKNTIWKLDLTTDKIEVFAKTDNNPNTILLSPDKKILFVSCRGINYSATNYYLPGPEWGSILLFDAKTGEMLDAIVAGNQPTGLAISPDGQTLFFSDFLDQTIEAYHIPPYEILKKGDGGSSKFYKRFIPKKIIEIKKNQNLIRK